MLCNTTILCTRPVPAEGPCHKPLAAALVYMWLTQGCSTLETSKKSNMKDLLGHRVDFVVHIISAKGIPASHSKKVSLSLPAAHLKFLPTPQQPKDTPHKITQINQVFCKYVYKWAEKDSYKTHDVQEDSNPEFDFKKRFAFSKMNQGLIEYFMSDNVITFEVIGEANPSDEPACA